MTDSLHKSFLKTLGKSYREYDTPGGSRSNRKLKPIHSWFAKQIAMNLGKEFDVYALGLGGEKGHEKK